MISIYACTLAICAASLVCGRAILALLGRERPAWLAGATGFAALVIAAPLLLRLPGRTTTAAIILGLVLIGAAWIAVRDVRRSGDAHLWPLGTAAALIVVAAASLPFLISDSVGVLGQGVYTNDHAAQLYWTDWLQHGFGPEPSAVRFGYPVGPQALVAIAATVTGASLVSAFNGLLLAIPALTALTALGALTTMPPGRRIAIAALAGLPYLAASFLAQSAFKETALALFVLAFAIALQSAMPASGEPGAAAGRPPWRSVVGVCLLLAAASVFTFSAPGLAWFALAVPIWLVLEAIGGRSPVNWAAVRDGLVAHKLTLLVGLAILIGIAAVAFTPAREFASKIADVQESAGRLSSPVFPGEALGIWPAGDFRIVRGEVTGSLLALALGAIAAGYGVFELWRRRRFALLAMLIAGAVVYLGARLVAEIHVEAKALAVIAPLVILVSLRALLVPGNPARVAVGLVVFAAAALSTLLALRDTPIGFDDRQLGLERLAAEADGAPVAFLGVDRFAGYYLRGTLARAPAGYVPEEIAARPDKRWAQGLAADFDSLDSGQLDRFRYAITTTAAHGSTAPPNFEPVAESRDYVLWRRQGETPPAKLLPREGSDQAGAAVFNPGATFGCRAGKPQRDGSAVVIPAPAVAPFADWRQPPPPEARVAGQERGFQAPGTATIELELPRAGEYALSLQYHSQVPLTVSFDGTELAELPASLDGMYLSGAGRGAFWPAGEVDADAGTHELSVVAAEPGGLAGTLDARRLVWLGDLAATPLADPRTVALADACDAYVDRYAYERERG